ncbi:MAG: RDD family protein [Lachnospiraceae bacterium]|nr:RDD family protein [Lachnospiraceae bacterium]
MNQDWNNRPSGEREPAKNMEPMRSGNPTPSTNSMQSNGAVPPVGPNGPMGAVPPVGPNGPIGAVPPVGTNRPMGAMPPTGQNRPMGAVPPAGINRPMGAMPPAGPNGGAQSNGINSMGPVNITKKAQGIQDNLETSVKEKAPAGFFIRLAAYLIDACITGCIIGMINLPLWFVKMGMSDSAIFQNILFEYDIFDILNFCLMSAYFVIMTYISGRTVGKQLLKIQVVSETGKDLSFGQVFFREVIGKYLSSILYIGYILVGIQDSKKGIHDMIADTKVVYRIDR